MYNFKFSWLITGIVIIVVILSIISSFQTPDFPCEENGGVWEYEDDDGWECENEDGEEIHSQFDRD